MGTATLLLLAHALAALRSLAEDWAALIAAVGAVATALLVAGAYWNVRVMQRQRRAAIRPVVDFRSDFAKEQKPVGEGRIRDLKANLVNIGNGVALNVRAVYREEGCWVSGWEHTQTLGVIDKTPHETTTWKKHWSEPL